VFITSRLRRFCPELMCVRLTAPREVLLQRISGSSEGQSWRLEHVDEGMALSCDPAFGLEIRTGGRMAFAVADEIMALLARRTGTVDDPTARSSPLPGSTR